MITTLQLLIFVSYVGFLLYKFKKPLPSISDSWYELSFPLNLLFVVFTWSLGILTFLQGDSLWFTYAGAGLCFVGAARTFKNTDGVRTNYIHYSGAVVGIVGSLMGLLFQYGMWFPSILWLLSVIALKLTKSKDFTWWVEISAFICIIMGYYLR